MAKEADKQLLLHLNDHPEAVLVVSRTGGEVKCSWHANGHQELAYFANVVNRLVNRRLDADGDDSSPSTEKLSS